MTDNTNNNTNSTEEVNKDEAPLIANKNKSILNQILYNIYQSSKDQTTFNDFEIEDYPNPDKKFRKEIKRFVNNVFSIGDVDTLGWGSDNQSPQVYITFGVLLAIIQTKIILHDNSRGSDTSIPLFRFDMNFNNLENDDNYILKIPGQFSSDPRICIIPYENTIPPLPDLELEEFDINTELKKSSYWNVNNEPYVGRLAALFVNIDYLTKVLDDLPLDEENNVNILDFLKGVIKGITQALGGINKINITITEDGLIRFIEEIPQRLKEIEITEGKQYARFNVFGVKPGIEGSFITSINLDAEIPSSFAATVAIGSQSNGNQKSGNATAFSNYNRGLKDRIIPEKITGTEAPEEDEDKEQKDQLVENFKKIFKVGASLRSPFGAIYNGLNWFPGNIDTLTNLNTTHASLMLGRLTQPDENGNQQLQSSFFLPFNFSIEMEGLSGMVLYEKFKISEEILPPSYEKGGVDIQIKGIDHTVNDKGWKTKLETQSVPAAKLSPISTPYPLNASSGGGGTSTGGGSSSSTHKGTPGKTPPQELIKAMKDYGITTPLERAHFLSQVAHESGNYYYKEEIASGKAYEGRKDLGNTQTGDGVRFKGRGYIQLTGRSNYQAYQNSLNQRGIRDNIMSNPSLVATKYAADSAAYWWKNIGRGGNGAMTKLALAGSTDKDVENVTKGVNGGTNGIDDRQTKFDYYWGELQQNSNAFT